jgi:hypothetical protein
MKNTLIILFFLLTSFLLSCVSTEDLNAWKGVPVNQLDTHSFWVTIPLIKTQTANGIEIRNYRNGRFASSCYANSYLPYQVFVNCNSGEIVCNNLFYIKDGIVLEYKPVGRCRTARFLQPENIY